MFIENIRKRVKDYDDIKKYYNENKSACNTEMDAAVRAAVVSIAILFFLFVVLFFMSIYYAFSCAKKLNWGPLVPFALVALTLLPNFGGFFMIGIVIYGMVNCGGLCGNN
jgi:hypothetical protein